MTVEPTGFDGAKLVDLPVITDRRGDLTFLEGERHVPFKIARVYYLYNVPVDAERGGHAHRPGPSDIPSQPFRTECEFD